MPRPGAKPYVRKAGPVQRLLVQQSSLPPPHWTVHRREKYSLSSEQPTLYGWYTMKPTREHEVEGLLAEWAFHSALNFTVWSSNKESSNILKPGNSKVFSFGEQQAKGQPEKVDSWHTFRPGSLVSSQ